MTQIKRTQLRLSPRLYDQLVKEADAEMRSLQSYLHILIDDGRRLRRMDRLSSSLDTFSEEDYGDD